MIFTSSLRRRACDYFISSLRRRAHAPHAWLTPRTRRGALRRLGTVFGITVSAALFSLSLTSVVAAQTPRDGHRAVPTTPPGKVSAMQGAQSVPSQAVTPQVPMSAASVKQAADQAEGNFPAMARAGAGGQIQESWNISEPRDGVYAVRICDDCVYKVRTREFMTTTIALPEDSVIVTADLGDPTGFQVQVRAANMIAVRPSTYGVDSNLNVYTKSGTVYPFYLRAESFNSVHVPDIVVRLLGREKPQEIRGINEDLEISDEGGRQEKDSTAPASPAAGAVHNLTHPAPAAGDFVRAVPFDPSTLRGWKDYELWGGGEDAERLKPEVVYRDDFFTYLQYGDAFDQVELPVAYVVRDGIDELVNSRVQGNTFIIESVAPLISLKNGKSFLCVQYRGKDA